MEKFNAMKEQVNKENNSLLIYIFIFSLRINFISEKMIFNKYRYLQFNYFYQ